MPHNSETGQVRTVTVPVGDIGLEGTLTLPARADGVILFAHGSGSSRFSPRNRYVAGVLESGGFATLLLDLLTRGEEQADEFTREHRFDIPLLADRLVAAIDWFGSEPSTSLLRVGLFGASTGGGAALAAAAERPRRVGAVVSRGGRPDLAGSALPSVESPTLLIVGERDEQVIELNEQARARMRAQARIAIVPGATHLFEETGTLEIVATLALGWFAQHLSGVSSQGVEAATQRSGC